MVFKIALGGKSQYILVNQCYPLGLFYSVFKKNLPKICIFVHFFGSFFWRTYERIPEMFTVLSFISILWYKWKKQK